MLYWLSRQSSIVYSSYEKIALNGDFNAMENECVFDSLLQNPGKPGCIDLYLKIVIRNGKIVWKHGPYR